MKSIKSLSDRSIKGLFLAGAAISLLLIAGVLTLYPDKAQAQGRLGSPKSPDQIVERLTDRLDLTEDQVEAIRPVIDEKVKKMSEIREDYGTDRQAARAEIQKLRLSTEEKLSEILTDEQREEYLELRQEQLDRVRSGKYRGGRMGKGFNKTPEQVIERMTYRLDLTEEQAEEIEPIINESIEKKRQIFDKYRDQGQNARQAMRYEMRTIGDETETELSTVLNDEQMEELRTIREEKRARMGNRMNRQGQRRGY